MDKSQWKISNGFLTFLLICVLILILASLVLPAGTSKTKVRIIATRSQIKSIAFYLNEYNKSTGHLPSGENSNIAAALYATFPNGFFNYPNWTNSNNEMVDAWRGPFQIQIVGTTNFIICSAGPNKIFGDADDIVFNSASNNFVKP
jgi:type II secretory pathway pseudopilin PulG